MAGRIAVLVGAVMAVVATRDVVLAAVQLVVAPAVVWCCFGPEVRSISLRASLPLPISTSVPV